MLEGIIRESIGKKSAKALKRDGYLIANVYAKGLENIHAAFRVNDFIKEVKAKENLFFDVKLGDKIYKVIIEDYQKDPVKSTILHVDLRVVLDDEISRYFVPIKLVGTPIGLKNKGVLVYFKRRLVVKCKGKDLPNAFVINVDKLDVNDSVLVRDIEIPQNVRVLDGATVAVAGVITAK